MAMQNSLPVSRSISLIYPARKYLQILSTNLIFLEEIIISHNVAFFLMHFYGDKPV